MKVSFLKVLTAMAVLGTAFPIVLSTMMSTILSSALPSAHAQHTGHATSNTAELIDGEIRRIDPEGRKLTIRHGAIKSLDMPGMTMVFQVRDAQLLEKVRTGDRIRFRIEKSGSALVVTDIEPAQ